MSSTQPESSSSGSSSIRAKKVVIPKVWKRPHSTIYGKNVEFGSSLYNDKIGEINGRKFNSELPWSVRNSGPISSSGGYYSQGYLSEPFNHLSSSSKSTSTTNNTTNLPMVDFTGKLTSSSDANFVRLLEITNPNRMFSKKFDQGDRSNRNISSYSSRGSDIRAQKIDFYEQYGDDFSREIDRVQSNSLLAIDPLVRRKVFDDHLDFDYSIGVFVPKLDAESPSTKRRLQSALNGSGVDYDTITRKNLEIKPTSGIISSSSSSISSNYNDIGRDSYGKPEASYSRLGYASDVDNRAKSNMFIYGQDNNHKNLLPNTNVRFGIASSPYGQSADGRKLSLTTINPHSYRPSVPQKSSVALATDGEEFEFHDRSSPFYTDR